MPAAIRKIANHLGRTLAENDVAIVADHCNVKNMRNNKMVNWQPIFNDMSFRHNAGAFINKGKPFTAVFK